MRTKHLRGSTVLLVLFTIAVLLVAAHGAPEGVLWSIAQAGPAAQVDGAAVSPPVIAYQGRLLDPGSGQPKPDGGYPMAFRIYGEASGGSPLWTETKTVAVAGGLFTTLLGDTTAFPGSLFDGSDRYLGVAVGSDPEASPRQRLGHTPYALHANNADTVDGQHASAFAATGHNHDGSQIVSGTVGEGFVDAALARDSEVMPIFLANDGSGSGVDADSIDGVDSASLYKGFVGTQVSGSVAANGGQQNWFTFGYSPDALVVWQARPSTTGGKVTWVVDIERGNDGNLTYWIRVTNTGTIATNYDLIRYTLFQ